MANCFLFVKCVRNSAVEGDNVIGESISYFFKKYIHRIFTKLNVDIGYSTRRSY